MKKYELAIEGAIETNVSHDVFLNEFYQWLESKGWTFGGVTTPSEEEPIHLELQGVSNVDFLLYYDTKKGLGFEAQFDNNEFNGIITFCEKIGVDEEEWKPVTEPSIYKMVKERALADYNAGKSTEQAKEVVSTKQGGKIVTELQENFVIAQIDFYEDGESIGHFIFRKSDVTEDQVTELYEEYNELYQNNEFDGAFEDFLTDRNIPYDILTFVEL